MHLAYLTCKDLRASSRICLRPISALLIVKYSTWVPLLKLTKSFLLLSAGLLGLIQPMCPLLGQRGQRNSPDACRSLGNRAVFQTPAKTECRCRKHCFCRARCRSAAPATGARGKRKTCRSPKCLDIDRKPTCNYILRSFLPPMCSHLALVVRH